ncbi:hypothetical protein [Candidatus Uabimicrobium sp. HlEnr_7]|uniref:hypothetical protein n=1 Tax=Candidatus Uabimicrobium helgolandensis TaxID=3095367 RepID=UPI003557F7D9
MKQSKIASDRQLRMKKVQEQFSNWRKNKSRRGSTTPKHLWEGAVSLHGDYSAYEIARDLGVAYSKLQSLISEASKTKTKPTPAFIQMEIPPPSQPKQNEWSIEMEKVDGTKMKISGSGLQMPDVALICKSFVECKR